MPPYSKLEFQCKKCKKWFLNEVDLKSHISKEHLKATYCCEACGVTLKNVAEVKSHLEECKKKGTKKDIKRVKPKVKDPSKNKALSVSMTSNLVAPHKNSSTSNNLPVFKKNSGAPELKKSSQMLGNVPTKQGFPSENNYLAPNKNVSSENNYQKTKTISVPDTNNLNPKTISLPENVIPKLENDTLKQTATSLLANDVPPAETISLRGSTFPSPATNFLTENECSTPTDGASYVNDLPPGKVPDSPPKKASARDTSFFKLLRSGITPQEYIMPFISPVEPVDLPEPSEVEEIVTVKFDAKSYLKALEEGLVNQTYDPRYNCLVSCDDPLLKVLEFENFDKLLRIGKEGQVTNVQPAVDGSIGTDNLPEALGKQGQDVSRDFSEVQQGHQQGDTDDDVIIVNEKPAPKKRGRKPGSCLKKSLQRHPVTRQLLPRRSKFKTSDSPTAADGPFAVNLSSPVVGTSEGLGMQLLNREKIIGFVSAPLITSSSSENSIKLMNGVPGDPAYHPLYTVGF